MPELIQYKRGEMRSYVTTRPFSVGSNNKLLSRELVITFDGTTAEIDGEEYQLPMLRGAVRSGWLVPLEGYDAEDPNHGRPVSANITVRHPTQGGNPMNPHAQTRMVMATTETDERQVGNVRNHATQARQANTNYRPGQRINRGVIIEEQDGIPVRTLQTPAGERAKNTRTNIEGGAGAAIAAAERVKIQPGVGITQDEMLSRMSAEEAEEYLSKKNALRSSYVEEGPTVVGRVKSGSNTRTEGGMTSTVSTRSGSTGTADLSGLDPGKPQLGQTESEGILFRTTNTGPVQRPAPAEPARPSVIVKQASIDIRRRVAKSLCPDFPDNYDFALSDKKKLARLQADYEDRHDVLKAVFAAEGDEFKAVLMDEFPEAFSS